MYATQVAGIGPWVNLTSGLLGKAEPELLGPTGDVACFVWYQRVVPTKTRSHCAPDFDRHAGGPSGCGLLRQRLRYAAEGYRGSDLLGVQT